MPERLKGSEWDLADRLYSGIEYRVHFTLGKCMVPMEFVPTGESKSYLQLALSIWFK